MGDFRALWSGKGARSGVFSKKVLADAHDTRQCPVSMQRTGQRMLIVVVHVPFLSKEPIKNWPADAHAML